jgi:hypothetical protein
MFCCFVHVFLSHKSLLDNHSTCVILSSKVWIRTPLETFLSLSLSLSSFLHLKFKFFSFLENEDLNRASEGGNQGIPNCLLVKELGR